MASRKRKFEDMDNITDSTPSTKRRKITKQSMIPPQIHDSNHNNSALIPCDECNITVPFEDYNNHLKSHQNPNDNTNSLTIPCEFCPQHISPSEYHQHIELIHNINNNHNESKSNENIEDVAFWLTKSPWTPQNNYSLSLNEVINPSSPSSIIESCIMFNYMFDIEWLFRRHPILRNDLKIENMYIYHGESLSNHYNHLRKNLFIHKIKVYIPYGTHHTKMIILLYKNEGIRIVITTANMIEPDWINKTNGIYVQDFPLKQSSTNQTGNDFESVLFNYCNALQTVNNHKMMDFSFLRRYDFSSAKILLMPSIPGYHKGKYLNYYGHNRLKSLLSKYNVKAANGSVIAQVSSIGSLTEQWVIHEFYKDSMFANGDIKDNKFKLLWPTVNDVRNSVEGYIAGGSLCFSNKNNKSFLSKYFCKWNAIKSGRMKLMPHIKSYCCVDGSSFTFFILTSANLSKAAWGQLQRNNTQIFIRSYEMGVLYLEQIYSDYLVHKHRRFCLSDLGYIKRNLLSVKTQKVNDIAKCIRFKILHQSDKDKESNDDDKIVFPIPMEVVNVTKYQSRDKPWVWDLQYNQNDINGLKWPLQR